MVRPVITAIKTDTTSQVRFKSWNGRPIDEIKMLSNIVR
jgi:hypothetical protein